MKQRSSLVESGWLPALPSLVQAQIQLSIEVGRTLSLEDERGSFCDRQVGLSVADRRWDVTTSAGLAAGDSFIAGVVDGVGGCTYCRCSSVLVPLAASCGCLSRG